MEGDQCGADGHGAQEVCEGKISITTIKESVVVNLRRLLMCVCDSNICVFVFV